jgi:hypothetical protein
LCAPALAAAAAEAEAGAEAAAAGGGGVMAMSRGFRSASAPLVVDSSRVERCQTDRLRRSLGLVGDLGDDACGAGPLLNTAASRLVPCGRGRQAWRFECTCAPYCLVLLDRSTSRMDHEETSLVYLT